jgi:hypothetical protein
LDLNDIWQQNKRWILGVGAGLVLFWLGTVIVRSIWNGERAESAVESVFRSTRGEQYYQANERTAAKTDGEELAAAEQRLRSALEYVPEDRFLLAGKSDPDLHFDQVSREVRRTLVEKAQQYAVELSGGDLVWEPPVGDEIGRTLLGLSVLHHAVDRLLDAGDRVRSTDPEALGVTRIDQFKVEKSTQRKPRRRGRDASVDVEGRIVETDVTFTFRADAGTVALFLEKCRAMAPALVLSEGFKIEAGRHPGDPLTVKGRVSALTILDA